MERGVLDNFSSVAEETDRDYVSFMAASKAEELHSSKREDGNNLDTSSRQADTNMFDGMCDGVVGAIALVHEALQDLLEFKDEMLKHALPPPVLTRLALITGRVFRSISDLGVPVGELVRLVRIYSSSWEEQNVALRKLHESFGSKQRQLNIALKRLQLLDAQSKQVARERCILNWQKLFLNVTSAKSHGRQWKFYIQAIKEKAKLGLEHVQAYTQSLDDSSRFGEEEAYQDGGDDISKIQDLVDANEEEQLKGPASLTSEESKDTSDDQTEEAPVVHVQSGNMKSASKDSTLEPQVTAHKVHFLEASGKPETARPPTRDAHTWTQEPDFDRSLFVRIFCPEGLQQPKLKCSLSYNGHIFKTPVLDSPDGEISSDNVPDVTRGRPSERPQAAGNAVPSKAGAHPASRKRFCELQIQLPDEVKEGVLVSGEKCLPEPETLRFAVHKGKFEEIVAMASLDFSDIKQMALETVYLPGRHGDDDVPATGSRAASFDGDSVCDSVDIPLMEDDPSDQLKAWSSHDDLIKNHDPQLLPFFPLHSGISDQAQVPSCRVPVLMYWAMRIRPLHFNRQCGTRGVLDMADFDLVSTASDEMHKETMDQALSAMTFTPGAEEEMILKTEYDAVVEQHKEEVARLQEEHEKQLEELINHVQAMQAGLPVTSHHSRPASKTSAYNGTAEVSSVTRQSGSNLDKTGTDSRKTLDQSDLASARQRPVPPRTPRPTKNFRVGHRLPRWGEHLPQDFFERLGQWEEDSKLHKQELSERTLRDIKENLERKLAGQYKLSRCEEQMYDALRDVSLPALFMPFKSASVYNPRAHQYFQATGATSVRLTQPPSVFQLPPLPSSKLSVVNLFELSKNFHIHGPTWLLEQYMEGFKKETPPATSLSPATANVPEKASLSENLDSRSLSRDREVET